MKIHLIAVGGAVMHNIALALQKNGHELSGSDDEIYDPSRTRLQKAGLLPSKMGWNPERITSDLDLIILGMHARPNNPELLRAQELNLPIYSFPEYFYHHAKDKKRVVVAGSHGKTTTTSMIMHVLKHQNIDFDYAVGAQLEGFENMVRFSDSPIMVIEGDEYLSSPIDRRPKFLHYKPDIAIITGIAWDHINVFKTFEDYKKQFALLLETLASNATLIAYEEDEVLNEIIEESKVKHPVFYRGFEFENRDGKTILVRPDKSEIEIPIFGKHNLQNLEAAYWACHALGIDDDAFFSAVQTFKGAAKRLQRLAYDKESEVYQDFAHAPSKVKATVSAMKAQFPQRKLVAYLELHTFSSLNKNFLSQYEGAMNAADLAVVYFSEHTLKMKKLPPITKNDIQENFKHPNLIVLSDEANFTTFVRQNFQAKTNVLWMSSGTFGGTNLAQLAQELIDTNKKVKPKMEEKKVVESKTIMTEMIMPNDTNPLGNLMGGNLLRWMDIVGGICAGKHCEAHVVTVSVDHVSFQKPIRVGDVITIEAKVTRAFNTSVEVYVEVFAANVKGKDNRRCNDAYFTFVGLEDETMKPKPVPKVIPLTKEEQTMHDGALRRREMRLILGGRLKPENATEIKSLFVENN